MPAVGQLAHLDPGPSCHPCPRFKDGETELNHEFDHVSLFPDSAPSQNEAQWRLLSQGSQAWVDLLGHDIRQGTDHSPTQGGPFSSALFRQL